ncbi:MAG: FkbM family methyltransferase, partial [Selenomonadaceae bacterium]|nr:FkbM family methyltransferase [Selenomonadaceae bacterium]
YDYFASTMLRRIAFDFKGGLIAKRLGAPGSVVVDVGANIGNHTLFFANELNAAKIIAFEPIASTFKILNFNIRLNRLDDRVELRNEGLSNRQGRAAVGVYNPNNTGGTVLNEEGNDGDISVMTLDALNLQSIALLKIDVEGMEMKVLEGALETIKRTRPIVFVEAFPENILFVEEFFAALDYSCLPEWDHNYLFCPSELDNWHDAELEDYDIVLRADQSNDEQSARALPFIDKYIGHDKIVALEGGSRLPLMEYALKCRKEYYLAWSARVIPLRATYFLNGRQAPTTYEGVDCMLIKTDVMRELIGELGGLDGLENVVADDFSEMQTYRRYVAEKYPSLYVNKKINVVSEKIFGRTLTADELRLLPFDVVIS